jgi:hypothetical protein
MPAHDAAGLLADGREVSQSVTGRRGQRVPGPGATRYARNGDVSIAYEDLGGPGATGCCCW